MTLAPLAEHPRVSVVIPCRDEQGYIGPCLRSIAAADLRGMDLRVFVCDGRSGDGTREEIQQVARSNDFIHLVNNPQRTTPHAMNLGLHQVPFDVAIILGAHAEVERSFFIRSLHALRSDPAVGCAGGLIESAYTDDTSRCIGHAMAHPFGVGGAHFRTGLRAGYVDTVAFGAYRREVFDEVGFFDEELVRNQDDEFNYRVDQAGFKILLDPTIRSRYVVRASHGRLWRQYFQYGFWKVYVNRKHRVVTTIRQLAPMALVAAVLGGAVCALFSSALGMIWIGMLALYVISGIAAAMHAARRIADVPGVLLAFWILHFAYGLGYWKGLLHFGLGRRPSVQHHTTTR